MSQPDAAESGVPPTESVNTSVSATTPAASDVAAPHGDTYPTDAESARAAEVNAHYDTRLPELSWSRRIQIPFIAAAVYSVIRLLGRRCATKFWVGSMPNRFTRASNNASGRSGIA